MDSGNVIDFPNRKIGDEIPRRSEPPKDPNGKRWVMTIFGIAGAAAFATTYLAINAHHVKAPPSRPLTGSFSTVKGEHRCEKLPEASEVCLNTGTSVRYVFTDHARYLEVISGEATFTVHRDPRPFEVLSGKFQIRDVSTQFDVFRKSTSTVLTVIDGSVKVVARSNRSPGDFGRTEPESIWKSAPEFHRLQQVEFDETTGMLRQRPMLTEQGLSQLMAWQDGEIDLTGRSLNEALLEFARYQPGEMTFNIPDREIRQLQFGGRVETGHFEDFLKGLAKLHGIHHKLTPGPHGDTVVTLSRRRTEPLD
jgi:transmembrane sensor